MAQELRSFSMWPIYCQLCQYLVRAWLHQASAINAVTTLQWRWWILLSLKTMESLQNGVALFSMRTVSPASSPRCRNIDADTWCKRALLLLGKIRPSMLSAHCLLEINSTKQQYKMIEHPYWVTVTHTDSDSDSESELYFFFLLKNILEKNPDFLFGFGELWNLVHADCTPWLHYFTGI